jgi:hypothetical protein
MSARTIARRHPDRPAYETEGGCGPRDVPRFPRAAAITGAEYVIDSGIIPTG